MSQSTRNRLNSKDIEKTIASSIKKEIAAANINTTTRKGNKELKFLIGQVARYPLDSLEQAEMAGTNLGKHIAEVSQQRSKQTLDADIIHQIRYQGELYSLAGLPKIKSQTDESAPAASTVNSQSTSEISTVISATETPEIAVSEVSSPSPAPEAELTDETQPGKETAIVPEVAEDSPETDSVSDEVDTQNNQL